VKMDDHRARILAVVTGILLFGSESEAQTRASSSTTPYSGADSIRYGGLTWRELGPFRGGRATAVAGVQSQPLVYYFGATGGGVWKTTDAGISWKNVSDGYLRMGSIGAIEVSPSDPNVVWVGTGESPVRGQSSSYGDGVYRSTDAGRTWTRLGLDRTRQISRIRVHPSNPDVAWVAAQGSRWMPTADRGVYRTTDGGKNWTKVLFVSDSAGPVDLAMDPTNPRILYAAFWHHQRTPWLVRSGGRHGGIWKTTDGGDTWTRLTEGLPSLMGKIGIDVSAANPDRVYAIIEADSGGLFRSDDAGKSWRLMSSDRLIRARAWYYMHLTADPKNADVVYVLNAPITRSIDGGRTFQTVPAKHGDNHALWINPTDSRYMINANDGGANVSLDGGRSWSTQDNQPTAQFYRVNTDNQFNYRLYAGQQDNSTVSVPSRTDGRAIDVTDWHHVGGCENAHIAFDPDKPRYVFAGCYQGFLSVWDKETGRVRNIAVYPHLGLAEPSSEQKYRFNWNAPVITSPHDRNVVYHGGNVLFRSDDRGQSWKAVSPDLTRNEKAKQGWGGTPITNEGAGGEVYNTIFYVVESPHERGTIWVGTDDGLVHITRDGGARWTNVTSPAFGEGQINAIEVSPHDASTAYIAVYRVKWDDYTPQVFRTTDYGRTWTRISGDLPAGEPVRVVREDPRRRGLLYAGTETGVYVSFDGGTRWTSLQRNLPRVPITDLQLRRDDLVASTEGRAFWILDDLSPLQQHHDSIARASVHLFAPRTAYLVDHGDSPVSGAGRNPPAGAILYYWLSSPDTSATRKLEIVDAAGSVIRTYTGRATPSQGPNASPATPLPAKPGLNRFVWNLRRDDPVRIAGLFTASPIRGIRVPPGRYVARLTVADRTVSQAIDVKADPRVEVSDGDRAAQVAMTSEVFTRVGEIHEAVIRLRDVRDQVNGMVSRTKDAPNAKAIADAGRAIADSVAALESRLVSPRARTFQDVVNFRNGLNDQYLFLAEVLDETDPPVTGGIRDRKRDLDEEWSQHRVRVDRVLSRDVEAFNALLRAGGVPPVVVPAAKKPTAA
jgi:photosystem II stability/assembly factor-like uncharacterized protein